MTKEDNHQGKTSHRRFFSFFLPSSESSTEPYLDGKNDISTYVHKRFEETKKYYKKRANQYGRLYIVLQILVIGVGASIPVYNTLFPSNDIANVLPVSSILGALIVVLSGTLGLLKVQEFWLLYATTLDQLEREYELFLHGIGNDYNIEDDKDGKKREKAFIKNLEEIIISKGHRYAALRGPGSSGKGNGGID
ncbi:MAG TPA: DUF4231 domain-containing protein [Nitrososphaeraceae archaeon]|nr:DUF4231 domain-containing protein [Nitrososphaeraceae archaeon]